LGNCKEFLVNFSNFVILHKKGGAFMAFYENYLHLCEKAGKTPSGAALEMGLSKPTVNRWKKGGGLTDATALKVAAYFGVTVAELKGEEQKEKPNTLDGIELEKLSPARRALLEALEGMDDENIMKIVRIAQAVKKELPE
jgi:transcriptional regulator with XRE-family HTH domain